MNEEDQFSSTWTLAATVVFPRETEAQRDVIAGVVGGKQKSVRERRGC